MPIQTGQELLNLLIEEIANADPEMLPPPAKKESGDKHIGVVEDETVRKVFSLDQFYRRESRRLGVDLESAGTDPDDDITYSLYKQKYETLHELFWYLLRSHMNLYEPNEIGIRQGWEVVLSKTRSENPKIRALEIPMPPELRKLLGLDD